MLSSSAKTLVKDLLQLFSRASGVAVELYEENGLGETVATITQEESVPELCRAVWELDGGRGHHACVEDMRQRAMKTIKSGTPDVSLCHAGLDTRRYPLRRDGEPFAVLQYGGFAINEDPAKRVLRLAKHRAAMMNLNATEEEAARIEGLLHQIETDEPPAFWTETQDSLPAIIERIISRYLNERERQRRVEREVYHDLVQRLTAAVHAADTLIDGFPEESDVRQKAERVVAALFFARQVAHNLWRGEYLPDKYDFRVTSLKEIVDEAVHLCRPEAESKELSFDIQLAGDPQVPVSRLHLQSAMNNLIHNAVKYSYRTTVMSKPRYVRVRGSHEGLGYELVITNYGIGFDPDEYVLIFEPGYKGRHTKSEFRSGAGQGLPLAKSVIERHNGRLSLTSTQVYVGSRSPGRQGDEAVPFTTKCALWLPWKQSR